MPGPFSQLPATARTTLAGFSAGQKSVTAIGALALLIGGVAFVTWASAPSMVPVFSNLAASDAAAITEELNARGTTYELADGGATVMVPQADVYQLRLDLSAAGLPEDGESGYELLDGQGITTSEFRQRVDYQRALEGELSKTISSIDGVEATTVHLVIPEEALFSEDSRQPSASVLVKTRPGASLAGGQVQAVVNLVSSSVEGLVPEQVTLADANGTVLSAAGADGAAAAAGDVRAVQTAAFERELQTSVQEMLTPVVGAGKAIVRVSATLDFDKRAITSETFNPEDKTAPAVSESVTTETYEGGQQVIGGVLGPENVGNPALPGGADSNYEKGQETRTLAVDKVTEQVETAPGTVQQLSVAVILDAEAAGAVPAAELRGLVAAAAGIDTVRGDVVEVSRMAFDTTAQDAAAEEFAAQEAAEKASERWGLARTVGVLLLVGLLLVHALRVMRRDQREPVELAYDIEAHQLALESEEAAALAAAERRALEPAPMSVQERQRMVIQGEIGELVERQPEEVAQLLRGWLADRRS